MPVVTNIPAPVTALPVRRNNPGFTTVDQAQGNRQRSSATQPSTEADSLREQRQRNAEIQQLKARDRAVRAHELAHSSVGGKYAGSPNFTYERGPDGVLYAIAGEVPIDVSPVPGDPQATLDKMQIVRRAALAPINPSAVDRAVAAQASAQAARARVELAKLESDTQEAPGSRIDLLV